MEKLSQVCNHLGIETNIEERPSGKNKEAYLKNLMTRAEQAGILIMRSGVVHNNSNRRLDPQEFRGFALCDDYAPVIFINNNDYPCYGFGSRSFCLRGWFFHIL